MKTTLYRHLAIVILVLLSVLPITTGQAVSRAPRGGPFFQQSEFLWNQTVFITDYSVSPSQLIEIDLHYQTNTSAKDMHIMNPKDIYLEISVVSIPANSTVKVGVADVWWQETIYGGSFSGVSVYSGGTAIGDHIIPFINLSIPYHQHIVLPGADVQCGKYGSRCGFTSTGTAIDVEYQFFMELRDGNVYQEYGVDWFVIYNGQINASSGLASKPSSWNLDVTLMLIFGLGISAVFLRHRKCKNLLNRL